ncbi:helix-turn-helix domain-containing protein [Hymenobacter wooponensis]|uniref:Helix-turn-helix domain-containing protein n=1 Tax=Hymenobacter wooponensis TaxID=1525360 RepID=A0A4Z0MMM5_9BACT|nr:helix-turn-helix domain-containing protein [Hymenobacter wooponensis]TGD80548.1 helix-turn-helix domain-containing protein [Hymenobacter wooponensis]
MSYTTVISPPRQQSSALKLKGFKVYAVEQPCTTKPHFGRRDYFKVILMTTKARLHYGHQSWDLDGTYLLFFNPHIPYSMEMLADFRHGYISLFTEEFIAPLDRSESLHQSPLFKIGSTPLVRLQEGQAAFMTGIFQKMLAEQEADYPFKAELIRTYLQLAIHEALHLQPTEAFFQHKNASSRLASQFLELLEQQFPVESPQQTLPLKTAQDFADRLAVHINHLNKAVKEVTGKPTSVHITNRITDEAKALLQHTTWSVAEIAYSLGFAYATYFNNFFKKQTGHTPLACRKAAASISWS